MNLSPLGISPARVAAPLPTVRGSVNATLLLTAAKLATEQGADLCAIWGSDERDRDRGLLLRVALIDRDGMTILEHDLASETASVPDLSAFFPAAGRMQRATFDLVGIPWDGEDQRPWLWQAAWPIDQFPLRRDFTVSPKWQPGVESYEFVRVEGEGVHDIAVGPVHAGIIEPGHFRFQVVGEKVLRLEERLSYVHKGIEKRFESMTVNQAYRLAGRVSGDATVAYAWAYAQAIEALVRASVPPRALALRALCLERERIANHLGDLGYLGNDAGFAFGLAQFSRLKEDVLRVNHRAFGHRMLMDAIAPGGIASDPSAAALGDMAVQCDALQQEVERLRDIYDEHAGVQDRFRNCGIVTPALARQLGLDGLAGRASGRARDARIDHPTPPYGELNVRIATRNEGDVAARTAVRFDELFESLRLCRVLLANLPLGATSVPLQHPPAYTLGIGYVESWRGPVFIALEAGPGGVVRRCHPHDVSWQNWPVLEHAVIGNIVPDFPLINKSFNLSYSGHDL
ncbi:MAG TPA: NADH-quinone oxidoreductase subunit C [Casimicrobiaceae bacterium]|nr:NADH-quinone oxidoreductase subunit C [Casimicrobiaceae bacterium]